MRIYWRNSICLSAVVGEIGDCRNKGRRAFLHFSPCLPDRVVSDPLARRGVSLVERSRSVRLVVEEHSLEAIVVRVTINTHAAHLIVLVSAKVLAALCEVRHAEAVSQVIRPLSAVDLVPALVELLASPFALVVAEGALVRLVPAQVELDAAAVAHAVLEAPNIRDRLCSGEVKRTVTVIYIVLEAASVQLLFFV